MHVLNVIGTTTTTRKDNTARKKFVCDCVCVCMCVCVCACVLVSAGRVELKGSSWPAGEEILCVLILSATAVHVVVGKVMVKVLGGLIKGGK